jgi:hypothetical protein
MQTSLRARLLVIRWATPPPPARDSSSFTWLTMTTRPSFRAELNGASAANWGAAVSMALWKNTLGERGEKGPWSEVATVAA